MRNPLQVANELETFKRAHNGGAIIDEAVRVIREQKREIDELTDAKMVFRDLLRFVKRVMGRRMERIAFRKKAKQRGGEQITYVFPVVADMQRFDIIMQDCEKHVPDSGVYGKL